MKNFLLSLALIIISTMCGNLRAQCVADTNFTDVIFLVDNSQSIDDLEFDAFEDIIVASIQKVQANCPKSNLGLVHYGGAFGRETFIEFDLSNANQFTSLQRQFCTERNQQGICPEGGDDLNNAIGRIIDGIQSGDLSRNFNNKLQLVIFTDAFGFDANCTFPNCSVIRPFTNIDLLKSQFGADVTVIGASTQAEASLLAIYASPGGDYDNTDLFRDCENTFDGCELPRKYIPIEFNSPIDETADKVFEFVQCGINVIQAINPEIGSNQSICRDLGESAMLTVDINDAVGNLSFLWEPALPDMQTVMVRPNQTTTYTVTVIDEEGCTGVDSVTVFVEDCVPDCSPDTSFTDILFLVDNSQSIDDQEYAEFEDLILTSIQKVQQKCARSQVGLVHYGGAFGAETDIEFAFSSNNTFTSVDRQFCTTRNSAGFCSEGGGDDLNNAIGDIIQAIENGQLNRNPINKLQLVIFTDAFGFDSSCGFINCSVIRPFTNIELLKSEYGAQVTVVGASSQAEASLLAIYASPGGSYDNTDLFQDCQNTVDGCELPRKYIPVEFNSEVNATSDSIVNCVSCEISVIGERIVDLGEDQSICSDVDGDNATIVANLVGGTAPFTFQWDQGIPASQTISVMPEETTTYSVTITDGIGCEASGSITVTVEDCIPDCLDAPIFTSCPSTYITCPGGEFGPDVAGMPLVVRGTETCPTPILTFEDRTVSIVGCNEVIERTWIATYDGFENLRSTCIQTIRIEDREAPIISNMPADIILDSDLSCTAIVTWEEPTAEDNCQIRSVTPSRPNGSRFEPGVTTVIYTAVDQCGNISMATFTVTVVEVCCTVPPEINCPDNFIGCPNSSIDPSLTGFPTAVAGPNCPEVTFTFTDSRETDTDGCTIRITRSWRAVYEGLSDYELVDVCDQIITLTDDTAPVLMNVPDDFTVDSDGSCTAFVTWSDASVMDDCEVRSITSDVPNGSVFEIGTTPVTITATDGCGNTATATFNVTVIKNCCTDPPIINCPADFSACPGTNIDPGVTGIATAEPGGPDCPNPTVSFSDVVMEDGFNCVTTITRTWTAIYPGDPDVSLTATCVQVITLTDDEGPIFTKLPDNIVVDSDESCTASVTWEDPEVTDNCGDVLVTSSFPKGSVFELGETELTFLATDVCGNTTSASITIVVLEKCCTNPPVIQCPSTYQGCPSSNLNPSITGFATAIPGGPDCPNPTISFSDFTEPGGDACSQTIVRTWRAIYPGETDVNLSVECTQLLILTDDEGPSFTSIPDLITIDSDNDCTARVTWPDITATDNCGDVTITTNIPNGSRFDLGITTVTCIAIDGCGNSVEATFNVVVNKMCCTDPPIIVCPADFMGCPTDDLFTSVTGEATARPGSPECPNPVVTFTDVVVSQDGCRREIDRIWSAAYPGRSEPELVTTCTQRIILDDTEGPTITNLPANITIASDQTCVAAVIWDEPVAMDNCNLLQITPDIPNGSTFDIGNTTVTYTAVDECGNTSSASFTVSVTQACCFQDPSITSPPDYTGCPKTSTDPETTGTAVAVSGGSFCDNPTVSFVDEILSQNTGTGAIEIKRTWIAVDPLNVDLRDSDMQIITLIDTEAPVLINCPTDITLDPDNPIHIWDDPTALDNCEVTISSDFQSGDTFPTGVTTVTITAVDGSGNSDVCTFDVTVPQEVEIICPDDLIMTCLEELDVETLPNPSINNICDECTEDNVEGYHYIGNFNGVSYYISERATNWNNAKNLSEEIGAQLAVIESADENEYLRTVLPVSAAYIGLSDTEEEGNFQWVDGTPLSYTNWFEGQPNNYGRKQDYVEFLKNGQWNDQRGKALPYIIEISCATLTKEIVNIEENDAQTVYTIRYSVVDRCGTDDECTFTVTSENVNRLTCPEDIVIDVPYGWSRVTWDDPIYETCCTICAPKEIRGYIYMGNIGDSYYYCSAGRSSWKAAERRAREIGGTLAVIETPEENAYISQRIIQRQAYIGLTDRDREGQFRWVDGQQPEYTSWMSERPDGSGDFVFIDGNGDWADVDGSEKREFVVEIKGCNQVEQTGGPLLGSTFRLGTTTITYTAKDGCGNETTCSFDVTITNGAADGEASGRSGERPETIMLSREISLYPNPVIDRLFIDSEIDVSQVVDVSVFQSDGQRVAEISPQRAFSQGVDVTTYSAGIHLLRVTFKDGDTKNKSFIIQ